MKKILLKEIFFFILALLPWLIMALILFPRIWFASESLRMIEVSPLGRDEGYVSGTIWGGWKTGAPVFYSTYGYLYFNFAWLILKTLSLFLPITEQSAIIVLRLINLICFFGIGLFSYLWMRKRLGILAGTIFSLLFFSLFNNTDFVLRATACQHDAIHLFAILLAFCTMLDLAHKFTRKRLIYSSILAGAVMSIKYSGFIFFPVIIYILTIHAVRLNVRTIQSFANTCRIVFKKILIVILFILSFIIIIEQISPTVNEDGSVYRLLSLPDIWIFKEMIIFTGFILLSLIVSRLFSSRIRITFWFNSLVFYILIFILTFQMLSARSLFKLDFIDSLLLRKNVFIYFNDGPIAWLHLIWHDTLGIFLFLIFISGSIIAIFQLLKHKIRTANRYLTIAFIWSWTVIIFLLISTKWATHRYLYTALPAMIFIIVTTILIFLYYFINPIAKRFVYGKIIILSFIMIIPIINSANLIGRELITTKKAYSCLDCIPGVQAGRWLEKRYSSKIEILQEDSVYIPSHFTKSVFISNFDPYPVDNDYQPDLIFIKGKHLRYVFLLNDEETDLYYYINAKKSKLFLSDLLNYHLPYKLVNTFGHQIYNNDILVFEKDGTKID